MNPVLSQLLAAARDVLRITFVVPVREGRPHPSAWPHGLREVGAAATTVFGLLALAIVFAGPLRQSGQLAMSGTNSDGVPVVTLPLLLTGVLLSTALAVTAALHSAWWLRLVLLVLGGAAVVFFLSDFLYSPPQLGMALLAYLALVSFTFVRSFRSHAWWEFPVVAGLLMLAVFGPWLLPGGNINLGLDTRPTSLHGALITLQPLVLPAMMVAGSAPAQIVVTAAQATADRPVGRGIFWTGFGIAVTWLAVITYLAAGGRELNPTALLASAVLLTVIAGTVALLLRRAGARIPPSPEAYPTVWGRWLYPLAAAVAAVPALVLPLVILRGMFQLLGQDGVVNAINVAWFAFIDNNPGVLWRWVLAPIAMVIAWRLVRRDRLAEAVALSTFSILLLSDAVGSITGFAFLLDRTTMAFGVLSAVVALVAAAVMAARRRFDRLRAIGVMTVVLLAVLYPYRNIIEDPTTVLAVLSPAVLLVFGLAWRTATEAEFTYESTPKYPQSTRVLLFLANTLLAATGVAYLALARAAGTDADPSGWGVLGDTVLGDPLYVTGLVTGLWFVLHPAARRNITAPEPAPAPPFGSWQG
jgi:hypothetical protein